MYAYKLQLCFFRTSIGDRKDNPILDVENFNHLAELCTLEALNELELSGSDFFSHSIFQYLDVRGDQISSLVLHDIDEMNLNAVILIGDRCPNLRSLALIQCHYQIEIEDALSVERIVNERQRRSGDTLKSFPNLSKKLYF